MQQMHETNFPISQKTQGFLPVTFLLLLLAPLHTQASGSVEFYGDVAPLLANRADLRQALESVDFRFEGSATRISHRMSPGLAGRRVGPYVFRAIERKSGGELEVRFASYVRFLDAQGKVIAELLGGEWKGDDALERATSLEEEIVAVSITPI